MKRSIAMILALLLLLAGCGQKAVTDISAPTTTPVISTSPTDPEISPTSTDPSTSTDPTVSKPDVSPVFVVHKLTLSDEDQEKIESIMGDEWREGGTYCAHDYEFTVTGLTLCYHSDCGTFIDITGYRYLFLSDEDREIVNTLLAEYTSQKPDEEVSDDTLPQNVKMTDFAVRLFKASEESGENALISPLSVLCALSMTTNGAEGETLQQMESVLGMTTEDMKRYLCSYMKNLPQGEKYKLSLANSIWFTDDERFTVNQDFLQTTADYYGADIYKAPFNDQTCDEINNWVNQKTDGMIPEILNEIPKEAVMYLVNALAFDAEWSEMYGEYQVEDGEFAKENGTKQDVTFMYSSEGIYLEDEKATGFMKMYKGGKYAFVAMLPNEGVSVSEYVASLDGSALNGMLSNPQYITVYTSIPKFETEYDVEMSVILKNMGMPRAFEPNQAEFAGIGTSTEGSVYINRVLHKTFISVGEKGTKAGATTAVEMNAPTGMPPEQTKEVHLDRPFVYMLIDCENNIPFFIGTLMDRQ